MSTITLPAPSVKPASAPITAKDRKRAAMWGLRLPKDEPNPIPHNVRDWVPPAVEVAPLASDDESAAGQADRARLEAIWEAAERTNAEVRRDLERLASGRWEPFQPTPEDQAEAALIFADARHSCLSGESGPAIGDRSFPRRPARRYTGTGMTDLDVHPRGVC